jgi:hypothetical protein
MAFESEYEPADETPAMLFNYKRPLELFEVSNMVKLCAPMVRYTK